MVAIRAQAGGYSYTKFPMGNQHRKMSQSELKLEATPTQYWQMLIGVYRRNPSSSWRLLLPHNTVANSTFIGRNPSSSWRLLLQILNVRKADRCIVAIRAQAGGYSY